MGVPQTGLKLSPGCTVKVYLYLLGYKERSRVLPKHIKSVYGLVPEEKTSIQTALPFLQTGLPVELGSSFLRSLDDFKMSFAQPM